MGATESTDTRVEELLDKMGWPRPEYASHFDGSLLASYLSNSNLEVMLPRHAPQMDITIPDRKGKMYPRPGFCYEGYKMHLAMIGPSSACKRQFMEFLPKITPVFQGAGSRLAPGREAVPYYFLDPDLHKMVLWELPEINFKQSAENYIKEIGLLYIDCVFMVFSDKYLLTDIYCKIVVAMAIHGIPFFVICTSSSSDVDEQAMQKIKSDFQKKDVHGIRIFNPQKPHNMLEELILDFYKEVSYNRGSGNREVTKDVSDDILGQTVRLKNLEKRPELNGRCGVCIGHDRSTDRYLARIITDGVEQDISLKSSSFSILKPKLYGQMVRVKGLLSKPELNGRYGFVDDFLRENERYRVFLPDRPGFGSALALKADNLEKVDSTKGAVPVKATEPPQLASSAKAAAAVKAKTAASVPKMASKPSTAFDPPAREKLPENGEARHKPAASNSSSANQRASADTSVEDLDDEDDLDGIFGPLLEEKPVKKPCGGGVDLMARISAAEHECAGQGVGANDQAATSAKVPVPAATAVERPRLQPSLHGLLGMRVWAVIGDPDEVEDILDHLMDCGKTVFSVSTSGSAHFTTTADLDRDPGLPKAEVLAFVDPQNVDVEASILDAQRFGLHGVILHPDAAAYGPAALRACWNARMTVHSADLLSEVEPGMGLPVAPLD